MGSAISALNGMRAKPRLYRFKRAEGAKSARMLGPAACLPGGRQAAGRT